MRHMVLSDLPEVMEIDAASLARPWSEGIWRAEVRSPFGTYLLLEEERISGYIGVKLTARELHIMTLAVRPEYRRRGYARLLVRAAISTYPEAEVVYLEVRPSNTAARALYDSLGFEVTGRRYGYYGDEDALLMTLRLRVGH